MLSTPEELKASLAEFAQFAAALAGDEKSEAQSYLEHLFRARGHRGVIEAGATFEFRVAKRPGSSQLERTILLALREAAKIGETDGLHLPEKPLPLDNLDQQIICADALFTPWPKADAIIGNPPYLGSR